MLNGKGLFIWHDDRLYLGDSVGLRVGHTLGDFVGLRDGVLVGAFAGDNVGDALG